MNRLPVFTNSHPLRLIWDIVIIFAALFSAILTTYNLTLSANEFLWLAPLVSILFASDILINFNTEVRIQQKWERGRSDIAHKYVKKWLIVDLLAALPIALLLVPEATPAFAFLRREIVVILTLLPIFKLLKVNSVFNRIEEALFLNPSETRLGIFVYWFALLTHFIAIGWILLGEAKYEGSDFHHYFIAVYWTVTTIATIGYGDVTPDLANHPQVAYTMMIQLLGVAVFGYIIGNISSFITELDLAKANFKKRTEQINRFFRMKKVPLALQEKVNNFRSYIWETRKESEVDSILKQLPKSLNIEILLHIHQQIIQNVSMFKGMHEAFIRDLVQMLESQVYIPNDYIVLEGDHSDSMYFLLTGVVDVVVGSQVIAQLGPGSPFGETGLLQKEKRNASLRAVTYCDVYKLSDTSLEELRQHYPEFDAQLKTIVAERLKDTASKLEHGPKR